VRAGRAPGPIPEEEVVIRTYLVVFWTVFVAEIGDKTQLATMLFASDTTVSRPGVFLAASAALIAATALGVLGGAALGQLVSADRLRVVAALGFIAIGAYMLVARTG
jgi:putative Ca2+/H+ antiporter (TMEM165/GDT1 family)